MMRPSVARRFAIILFVGSIFAVYSWATDEEEGRSEAADTATVATSEETGQSNQPTTDVESKKDTRPTPPVESDWKKLDPNSPLWLDIKNKTVIVGGEVCFRNGPLEMFACLRRTKEHESVVTVDCRAFKVHAALLATGLEPGSVVEFSPEYKPATGPAVDIHVEWVDEKGKKHRSRAQDWVRNAKTGKAMEHDWVFAGSGFWTDEDSGERFYLAEGGELICVSNFSTATLDLAVQSSAQTSSLMFTAFTENIPPLGTKVFLYLSPKKTTTSSTDAADSQEEPARSSTSP